MDKQPTLAIARTVSLAFSTATQSPPSSDAGELSTYCVIDINAPPLPHLAHH